MAGRTTSRYVPTPAEAKKLPTPEGKGWWIVRALATKNNGKRRPPITVKGLAALLNSDEPYAKWMLDEAMAMGWVVITEAGYQGRI